MDLATTCDLCDRALPAHEPRYPVRFTDAESDVEVCIECAAQLSRDGIGAWSTNIARPSARPAQQR